MCVIIDRDDLHSVFKDDVALLEVFYGPSDRIPSFHRHFDVFFMFKIPFENSMSLQSHNLTEASFDGVINDVTLKRH